METSILFAILLAVVVLALAGWRVQAERFRALPWLDVGIASALFWGLLATGLRWYFWETYYSYFTPAWSRWLAPLAAVFYFFVGLLLRWIALHLPGNPAITFLLLGGLESIPEHALGIYRFHILEIPLLAGSTALSIFLFAFFEYIVYWSIVLGLALLLGRLLPTPPAASKGEL
jgi:hypothetical protein